MIVVNHLDHPELTIDAWTVRAGDSWCVLGKNGAGKQRLDALLLGQLSGAGAPQFRSELAEDECALVSFETQQELFEQELRLAANDLVDEGEGGTRAIDLLPAGSDDHPILARLQLSHRLSARYRELSTGESRKLLIAQAVINGARLIVLDNPYDSLDPQACVALNEALAEVSGAGISVVLLLSNRQDIPAWCRYAALLEQGSLRVLGELAEESTRTRIGQAFATSSAEQPEWPETAIGIDTYPHNALVELHECSVSYGGNAVLKDVTLTIKPLQHTLITGENGAGKSTLLGLITGDCPQVYSNDVQVLGHQRGSGESIWDIKRALGIVSSDLHRRYRISCSAIDVVCSGFFDSIGLYESPSDQQITIARQWLTAAGLDAAAKPWRQLSYGEQRLVLIARALVKSPLLLILDEPTQGLDEVNRYRLLDLLAVLEARRHSTVVFVSHRADEYLPMFSQHLHLRRQ